MATESKLDSSFKQHQRKRSRDDEDESNELFLSSTDSASSTSDSDTVSPKMNQPKQRKISIKKRILEQFQIVTAINELQVRIQRISLSDKDDDVVQNNETKSSEDKANKSEGYKTTPQKRTRAPVETNTDENENSSNDRYKAKLIKLNSSLPATHPRVTFKEPELTRAPVETNTDENENSSNDRNNVKLIKFNSTLPVTHPRAIFKEPELNPTILNKDLPQLSQSFNNAPAEKKTFGFRKMGRSKKITEAAIEDEHKCIMDKNMNLLELARRTATSSLNRRSLNSFP